MSPRMNFRPGAARVLRRLAQFGDESGVVAVIFAVAAIPVVLMIGAAVDYQRAVTARSRMQSALDAAVLSGVKQTLPADRIKSASAAFDANVAGLGLSYAASFSQNPDGTFSGRVDGQTPTAFMRAINVPTISVGAKSRAAAGASANMPTSLTFTALTAKGWFWKNVTLWVHHPGDAADTALANFTYQPNTLLNGGSGVLTGPFGSAIALGSNYDKIYLTMTVMDDGCAPGMAPAHPEAIDGLDTTYWDTYQCLAENPPSVVKTHAGYSFASNDPATANHLFVDGKQLAVGTVIPPTGLAKCNASVNHGWEDSKLWNPSDPQNVDAWSSQDFEFNVTGGPCASNTAMILAQPRLLE